ncbi:MAG: PhnA domain-containing protein [Saprospiraceae bacterium]|jgi:protein PhnA|nr:PhnA domain-containing protein [Saprospiraceae bacterium]MBL0023504.1 PhnA domain-containing protein [Saprospiraceae bacterium]
MSLLSTELTARCRSKCEICNAGGKLYPFIVFPKTGNSVDEQVAICGVCKEQMENVDKIDVTHWRCLNESVWSTVPAVQVLAYRMLGTLSDQDWAHDLQGNIYMDDETLEWAETKMVNTVHMDCNGKILESGDTVVLIKDLDVKGANFSAKRGTAVRRILLVQDNPDQIEGRVNDQQIIILTKYVKKSV